MAKTIQGGCRCGEIRYEFSASPTFHHMCYCRDCRYFTGSDRMFIVGGPRGAFRLIRGDIASYATLADSGATIRRAFCPRCGTSLLIYPEIDGVHYKEEDDVVGVSVATLDEPNAFRPDFAVFTSKAPAWASIPDGLDTYP